MKILIIFFLLVIAILYFFCIYNPIESFDNFDKSSQAEIPYIPEKQPESKSVPNNEPKQIKQACPEDPYKSLPELQKQLKAPKPIKDNSYHKAYPTFVDDIFHTNHKDDVNHIKVYEKDYPNCDRRCRCKAIAATLKQAIDSDYIKEDEASKVWNETFKQLCGY